MGSEPTFGPTIVMETPAAASLSSPVSNASFFGLSSRNSEPRIDAVVASWPEKFTTWD